MAPARDGRLTRRPPAVVTSHRSRDTARSERTPVTEVGDGTRDLERRDQLRSGHDPGEAVQRDVVAQHRLQPVREGHRRADPLQACGREQRQRGRVQRHRQGPRGRRRQVRHRDPGGARSGRADEEPHDRHRGLRRPRRHRPDLLEQHLLPGAGRGRRSREALRAAAQGHEGVEEGRHRALRHARQAVPRHHPPGRQPARPSPRCTSPTRCGARTRCANTPVKANVDRQASSRWPSS